MYKKAFLGAPFANYINPKTGILFNDKKQMIITIIKYLERKGYQVENSHIREFWGKDWMAPKLCTPLDYQQIKEADLFIAIPGNPPSGGVHIELGWASVFNTRTIMLLEKGKKYSNLVLGLDKIGRIDYVVYNTLEECLEKMDKLM